MSVDNKSTEDFKDVREQRNGGHWNNWQQRGNGQNTGQQGYAVRLTLYPSNTHTHTQMSHTVNFHLTGLYSMVTTWQGGGGVLGGHA